MRMSFLGWNQPKRQVLKENAGFNVVVSSHLWWYQPSKEISEDNIVAKGDDVLDLPEY